MNSTNDIDTSLYPLTGNDLPSPNFCAASNIALPWGVRSTDADMI